MAENDRQPSEVWCPKCKTWVDLADRPAGMPTRHFLDLHHGEAHFGGQTDVTKGDDEGV